MQVFIVVTPNIEPESFTSVFSTFTNAARYYEYLTWRGVEATILTRYLDEEHHYTRDVIRQILLPEDFPR